MNTRKVTDFFNNDYVNYSSYDNLRKIPSLVDGMKNAARKVTWFIKEKNIDSQKKEIKVSQLDSKAAEFTEYLHGSMAGVIVNLAQDYTGTNNINLLSPEGNFGTRLVPEASAPRYIYTYGSKELFELLNKDDDAILEHQEFEGHKIEPKFLLPSLPLLLINGAEGISSGYASKILPRNPDEIKKYITYYLKKPDAPRKPFKNKPFYRGFTGDITPLDDKQWLITGKFTRKANKVQITELPIGYNLKSYKKVLDKLEDDKVIITYEDFSQDSFNITVQFNRKQLDSYTDKKLIDILKLSKKVTENYTVTDENNRVIVYENINDILWHYIDVKKRYIKKRKTHLLKTLTQDIKNDVSRYTFIKAIIDETLQITKRPTEDIIKDLDNTDKIIKIDNSYDYLLNMNIRSLTEERMNKLIQQIKEKHTRLKEIKDTTEDMMWLEDLK